MDQLNEQKKLEPTRSELEILQVLWQIGPATVRSVNDELIKAKDVNYTTTLKLMQIMADKGILKRDASQMKHVYYVAEPEEETKSQLLNKFVDAVYQGAAGKLVMQLLGSKKASKKDLESIRELLDKLEDQ